MTQKSFERFLVAREGFALHHWVHDGIHQYYRPQLADYGVVFFEWKVRCILIRLSEIEFSLITFNLELQVFYMFFDDDVPYPQYFLMTDYALWEVIVDGDSPLPKRTIDGAEQTIYTYRIMLFEKMAMLTVRAIRFPKKTRKKGSKREQEQRTSKEEYESGNNRCKSFGGSRWNWVSTCSKGCLKSYETLKEHYDNLSKDYKKSQLNVGSYKIGLESVEARLVVYRKNKDIFEENIKILKLDIHLRDNALTELRKKLENANKEKDEIKITLEKFENSSKTLNKMLDSQVNDKYKTGVGYHAFLPLYIGNFMLLKPNLILVDVDEYVVSESVTSVHAVATNKAKTSESKPKSVEFVKLNEQVESPRESVKQKEHNRQAKHPRKNNQSPREIDGGYVAFRGDPKGGKIIGKGKISTDTKCVVLSPDFKLLDESQVFLRVHRKNNMYSVDLKNVATSGDLTCLFAKATLGIENLKDLRVKVISCDNKTEFKNRVMNQFCEMKGIKREFSVARTLEQNGVAKRKNRTLIEVAKTMITDSKLTITFWAEVDNTACYVQNRVLVIKPHNKTPYELFLSKKPTLSFMRPFRCPITILNTIDHLVKFDGKANEGFFVGYSTNSKAFRVLNSRTRIVEENLHVKFSENTPNITRSRPNWLFDIDSLTKSMNYKPIIVGNQSNGSAGKAKVETVPDKDYILLPLWTLDLLFSSSSKDSPGDGFKPSGEEEKKDTKDLGNEESEAPITKEPRVNQEKDSVNSTNIVNAVSLTINAASNELLLLMDVKSAFLYGKIDEEVYVCQPLRFEDPEFPNRVYKVEKALYGLHHAPRAWKEMCTEFEKMMHKKFQMSSMGDPTFFLGLQVTQKDDGIFISQDKCVDEILKKFGFSTVKTASTPMETSKPLMKDENAEDVDVHLYRSIISSLIYLTSSRPDIMFVDSLFDLEAYTDSDYAGASLDRKSTIGSSEVLIDGRLTVLICNGLYINDDWNEVKQLLMMELRLTLTSCIKQFWVTAKAKNINGKVQIHAKVDGKKVIIYETTIRRYLKFEDEDGVDCLSNEFIFEQLPLMRVGKDFSGRDTPLFPTMLVPAQKEKLVNILGSGEDRLKLQELMKLCTKLSERVLDLETTKTAQAKEISSLKRRVKRLEKKKMSRTHWLKRLYKIGLFTIVESSVEEQKDQERYDDQEMFDTDVFNDEEVVVEDITAASTTVVSIDDITLAQALVEIKTSKPKERDYELVARLQEEEQGELTIEEKLRLFVELMDKRKKHFAKLKVEE
nr:retrovirus-related Pol polyprotein from transposon TNT 1-94 [Tanacetum cinerariifolium]